MLKLENELYDITKKINAINDLAIYWKEMHKIALYDEQMDMAFNFFKEYEKNIKKLDTLYIEQEKIYHNLLIKYL